MEARRHTGRPERIASRIYRGLYSAVVLFVFALVADGRIDGSHPDWVKWVVPGGLAILLVGLAGCLIRFRQWPRDELDFLRGPLDWRKFIVGICVLPFLSYALVCVLLGDGDYARLWGTCAIAITALLASAAVPKASTADPSGTARPST